MLQARQVAGGGSLTPPGLKSQLTPCRGRRALAGGNTPQTELIGPVSLIGSRVPYGTSPFLDLSCVFLPGN